MQVGLDIVTSANCKSQLQFQLDEYLFNICFNFNQNIFNQQRLWADGILIPNLHKALLVGRHLKDRINATKTHRHRKTWSSNFFL